MARKKRRGRPPGSKNKVKASMSVAKMDVAQLHAYISGLRQTLAAKIQDQRKYFESQLAGLGIYTAGKGGRSPAPVRMSNPRPGLRKKPAPKYQSKKNRGLKWTGRGMLPVWMRDEMRGTKLKKDDFLIK